MRETERAVAAGGMTALASRIQGELAHDSLDARAIFERATFARLTYRYDDAGRDYARLRAMPAATGGRYVSFAALGQADMFFVAAREPEAAAAS
ncbi:MAG: hypothetical protein ACRENC_16250, partial [Gemmatimonadaceae bacterium]